ncbi:MAG: hypothetical protein P9F19_13285 [Candidatus Contendobacter sp.]|nr:hypothetical protein [Candidatus Contendobacter sp.]MDG4558343.1 hypothetical protein [Candidatus Contendobacter sp.]
MRRIGAGLPKFDGDGFAIAAADGGRIDRFDANGRHQFSQVGRAPDVPDIPANPLNPSGNAALLPDLPGNWPMRYRRSTTPGATYFFTVVTYRRRAMLCEPDTAR